MGLITLLDRTLAHHPLSEADAVWLLRQTDPEAIAQIRAAADALRSQLCGETVTYVINRNINFTNICEQHCGFCAFRRDAGDAEAYWLDEAMIIQKAREALQAKATELCLQGGLNPQAKRPGSWAKTSPGSSLDYYLHLIDALKSRFPTLHLHAFSPQEIEFIAREDDLTVDEVLKALRQAGVDSLPGTAAEVLDDAVRRVICPEKITSQTWLNIVSAAHRAGLPTTSTMLCGHVEMPEQQVQHLAQLRRLQADSLDRWGVGITEFILLPYVGEMAPAALRRRVGHDQPRLDEVLKLTAVARLYLGTAIVNHQPSWVKLGLTGAQRALEWGCNDLGGTLMEEHITTSAGAQGGTGLSVPQIQQAIAALGRPWQQRTTLYQRLRDQPQVLLG
ncbi:7,8-didemethyl-8-hydroxy-5-deazariboflavin synthase subunit CofH [Lyngbya confervoides]|uniref:5-amino-6-(D-ribitylamino)uracil--L-tyrosine 4-hydroxyphenyl transferase n=1 Tax=Lyngbya confervoides BDU141951 TaxID=1574623 RepID=A0ABD4SYL6_9CYAN|nr:7,8-didemethyl-8-hydroxy-5-deazariboflavin synthase subunit CofH [Lyngbya confervoides]MCM1981397.1 7,8-didemethyl-8-hydroxy-5-deazariboflavin synthase subunit CofH [Lyngbya confervoides BDU141951]